MKIIFTLVALCIFSQSCTAQKKRTHSQQFLGESQFKDYIPVSPLEYEQEVEVYNASTNLFEWYFIKQLAAEREQIIKMLPNEAAFTSLINNNQSGELSYGPAAITGASGSYTVIMDYCKFTTLKVMNDDKSCPGFAKVGVGLRIRANIQTFEAGIDVSSLFGLAVAAKQNKLSGQLSVDIIGIESSKITDLITLPVDISEASIQTALQSMAAIKSKIYDTGTRLHPQVVAVKRAANGHCSVFDILRAIDPVNTPQQQQQQQQQKQQQQQQQQQQQSVH